MQYGRQEIRRALQYHTGFRALSGLLTADLFPRGSHLAKQPFRDRLRRLRRGAVHEICSPKPHPMCYLTATGEHSTSNRMSWVKDLTMGRHDGRVSRRHRSRPAISVQRSSDEGVCATVTSNSRNCA